MRNEFQPSQMTDVVQQLVRLSRELAQPQNDYVILSEGNTSLRIADGAMLVKASGASMVAATAKDFVPVEIDELLSVVADPAAEESDVDRLYSAVAKEHRGSRPSVEALLHAVCLEIPAVAAVGHTHPTAVNVILCSLESHLLTQGSIFPDQIVVLGPEPLLVEYVDPGLALARVVRERLAVYLEEFGVPPKVIYLQNHGMFALGQSTSEVLRITAMAVKTARILLGAHAFGGVRFLPHTEVTRIHTRPDEIFRRVRFEGEGEAPGDSPDDSPAGAHRRLDAAASVAGERNQNHG